jgi:hypothetical protein
MRTDWTLGLVVCGVLSVLGCGSSGSSVFGGGDSGTGTDATGGMDSGSLGTKDGGHKDSSTGVLTQPDAGTGGKDGGCATPITCASVGATCGPINNGCGGTVQCGTCPSGDTCGGGGKASQCGSACVPKTCADLGFTCGPAGDGCGNMLNCGSCSDGGTCGGGGTSSQCGSSAMCVPTTCAAQGFNCGPAGDGCGNSLDCGTCTGSDTCGGGGAASVCGAAACVPKTCADVGTVTNPACGPAADGCGGLLACGTCAQPQTCGGISPGLCGTPSTCTGLCLNQVTCSNPAVTTTVSGIVYAPNGTDPLPNVLVYIPNQPVLAFTPGVACDQCSAGVTGSPLVTAATDTTGAFTLSNVPVGSNIPLVIQTGRWRRQTVIPSVASCVNTPLPTCTAVTAKSGACLTSLPQTKAQGDIPKMAFATGAVDSLECVMRKVGVQDSEFTQPSGTGRINIYLGDGTVNVPGQGTYHVGGATAGAGTPSETTLVNTPATLDKYDMVLFPCKGDEVTRTTAQQTNLINYANAGGRVFATHFSYAWLFNDAPFNGTADWNVNQCDSHTVPAGYTCSTANGYPPDQTGYVNTTFPKGLELAQWLQNIGASTTLGQIPLNVLRWDTKQPGAVAPSQEWMQIQDAQIGDALMHYTFNTPVGAAAMAQCGRVLFDDFHVENHGYINAQSAYGEAFPTECACFADAGYCETNVECCSNRCDANPASATYQTCLGAAASCHEVNTACTTTAQCCGGTCTGGVCVAPMTPQEKLLEFMIFDLGSCVAPDVPTCTPTTCAAQGLSCGPAGDGCGNVLQCGTCPAGETCGGGGTPSVCGSSCTAKTCAGQGIQCGPAGDGCGNSLSCGTCPAGQTCGGGGMPGVCGAGTCTPTTCAGQGIQCGPAGDGCGGSLSCGTCPAGETCGGGGTSGVCGTKCTPQTCAGLGYNCGAAADGCGGSLSCGTCSAPNTCGGGGQANICGGSIPK